MIKAEIVAHSLSPQGDELISILCTFPRIILAEVNTHRMLSKNTSSSRAIPFTKMVESVQSNPFIPIAWQKAHNGMQGSEYITDPTSISIRVGQWLTARDNAVKIAKELSENITFAGGSTSYEQIEITDREGGNPVTKQLCNRLLEPFMWTTMLITGPRSGWDNFFNLRCPQYEFTVNTEPKHIETFKSWKNVSNRFENIPELKNAGLLKKLEHNKGQAEIHIMDLAEKIYDAVNESTPEKLKTGEWHIPFKNKLDYEPLRTYLNDNSIMDYDTSYKSNLDKWFVKVSTAMAARTSYTIISEEPEKVLNPITNKFVDNPNYKEINYTKMIELHDRLISQDPPHSSPLEHCARAMGDLEYTVAKSTGLTRKGREGSDSYGWCNNFKGFIPYRYIIDNKLKM